MKKIYLTLLLFGAHLMNAQPTTTSAYKIISGATYEHYKGMRYKVLMIVWNSELDELEPWVVYQGLYEDPKLGANPIFTRSLTKFSETIELGGIEQPRFKMVSAEPKE